MSPNMCKGCPRSIQGEGKGEGVMESNRMQPNATELKDSPLLRTPERPPSFPRRREPRIPGPADPFSLEGRRLG